MLNLSNLRTIYFLVKLIIKTIIKVILFTVLTRAQEMRTVHRPKCRKTLFVITVTELFGADTT